MERRKFVKQCCFTAIATSSVGTLLQACGGLHYANPTIEENKITIAKSEFISSKGESVKYRKYVLIKEEGMSFPICVYRFGKEEYVASLLRCTHNSCELNVGGGIYTCPCHGSEFSSKGEVLEGPAVENLYTYKITTDENSIFIHL